MSQLPSQDLSGPADSLRPRVQQYWNDRCNLLKRIRNLESRKKVAELIDERVIERMISDVLPHMMIEVSSPFSDFEEALAVFRLVSPKWTDKFLPHAIPYVGVVYYRYMETPEMKTLLEDWDAKDSVVSTVLAAAGPWLALQGLAVVGFTAGGVAAGSLAALWQSAIGNVAAGSLFSSFQSMGALGALTGPWGIAASVAGVGAYGVYKMATQPSKQERFHQMVCTLLEKGDKRNEFWKSIKV